MDLVNVKYNPRYRMNKGSLSQQILHLQQMVNNVKNPKKDNNFQITMYPVIEKLADILSKNYVNRIKYVDDDDINIFGYFLNGPKGDGSLYKATKNKYEQYTYDYCELGQSLRAIKDRIYHIGTQANLRKISDKYTDQSKTYDRLSEFVKDFKVTVDNTIDSWKNELSQFKKIS